MAATAIRAFDQQPPDRGQRPELHRVRAPLLDSSFELIEAGSSTIAAIGYRDASPKPTVVCLAEGLPLMSEDLLVDVIRRMAMESGTNPPQFYLLSKSAEVTPDKATRYAGVVKKSFVPQAFVDEFRRVVLREQSPYERLRHVVREGLHSELVTATQQTIGVMIGSEIHEVAAGEGVTCPVGVVAQVTQLDVESGVSLVTLIASGRAEVERMGSQIVRREITFEEGAGEVLGELANTIAGRVRACLVSRGFDLKMGLPEIRDVGAEEAQVLDYDIETIFRTTGGEILRVALRVNPSGAGLGKGNSPDAVPEPAAAEAAPEPVAVGEAAGPAPGEAPEQKSVDDVLF